MKSSATLGRENMDCPRISLVVAVSQNNIIGREGSVPWHLPEDLTHFRELTTGHSIIMGRRTYETIGKALKKRKNIVLSRRTEYEAAGCFVAHTLEEALEIAGGDDEVFIIGGGEIYRQTLPIAHRVYLTHIHRNFKGDATFPQLDDTWQLVHRRDSSDKIDLPYSICIYQRID